jgi:hypothetical protein
MSLDALLHIAMQMACPGCYQELLTQRPQWMQQM